MLYPGRTLVFTNSIDCIKRLQSIFNILKRTPLPLHAQMEQKQRLTNLEKFSSKQKGSSLCQYLIVHWTNRLWKWIIDCHGCRCTWSGYSKHQTHHSLSSSALDRGNASQTLHQQSIEEWSSFSYTSIEVVEPLELPVKVSVSCSSVRKSCFSIGRSSNRSIEVCPLQRTFSSVIHPFLFSS